MSAPRIAIIGSWDPKREQDLELKNVSVAKQAGEDIGRSLAKQKFHIIVYASYEYLFEVDVVNGYTMEEGIDTDSIQVLFSASLPQPHYVNQLANDPRFNFAPDTNKNWEMSFYRSIAEVDGVVLLGGGTSTLIAGIVALGHKKPIVACAAFGGGARKVWEVLGTQNYPLEKSEIAAMADERWSSVLAEKLVGLLNKQIHEFARRKTELLDEEQKRSALKRREEKDRRTLKQREEKDRLINIFALIAIILFVFGASAWPIAWGINDLNPGQLIGLLLVSASLMGAAGSTGLVVINELQSQQTKNLPRVFPTIAVGLIAAGAAAILFVLAQAFATPPDFNTNSSPEIYKRLIPFTVAVGLIAGLTFEAVFSKLRSINVVRTEAVSVSTNPNNAQNEETSNG